jgi:hypothetical protein
MTNADALALFAEYRGKPINAVQVTAENVELLGELDGLTYEPETDEVEMSFSVRVEPLYHQGICLGDWIATTAVPGLWSIYAGDAVESVDFPKFSASFETTAA